MGVFLSTLNQMGFLILLIAAGYILVKLNFVEESGAKILSKLENYLFIPALVLSTFITNFTVESFSTAWKYLLCGTVVVLISAVFAVYVSKLCTKDDYIRKIYTYGLSFANFGFMGNAVVAALFPDVFMNYLIYVLPFWTLIYVWGVPYLLMPSGDKKNVLSGLKKLINPMFIAMLIGMVIGIFAIPLPSFIGSAVSSLGSCMSPVAMLLTGMTIAKINLKATFKNLSIYAVSAIRLVLMPLVAIVALMLLKLPYELSLCTVCALAMPLGLNTVVVPSAYGKDTSVAAGMALISHLLSLITIPVVFMLFQALIK
ncbi:MAG: AEC family transporter [Clostridia bacterium]|nr:AEC family transporter [Clostridia bacterium]